jgi:hypothetical protein
MEKEETQDGALSTASEFDNESRTSEQRRRRRLFFSSKGPKILFVGDGAMLFQDSDLFHEIVDESGLLANAPHHERDPAVGIITDFVLLYHLVVHFAALQLLFQLILLRHDRGQLFGQSIQFLMAAQR